MTDNSSKNKAAVTKQLEIIIAKLDTYDGIGRSKKNSTLLAQLKEELSSLTDLPHLILFLKKLGSIRIADNYGHAVRIEELVKSELKTQKKVWPASLHYDHKETLATIKFPRMTLGLRKIHFYELLSNLYHDLLPLYESAAVKEYSEHDIKKSPIFQQMETFVTQSKNTYKGKFDLGRDIEVCGLKHLGTDNSELGTQLSPEAATAAIRQQLSLTNSACSPSKAAALSTFLLHHGGADLGVATASLELNNTLVSADGAHLNVSTGKMNPASPANYRWDGDTLVGEFNVYAYSLQNNNQYPPSTYMYDPKIKQFVSFHDLEANEGLLKILKTGSHAQKQDFTFADLLPCATMKVEIELDVDDAYQVQPKVISCKPTIVDLAIKHRPRLGAYYKYNNHSLSCSEQLTAETQALLQDKRATQQDMAAADLKRDTRVNGELCLGMSKNEADALSVDQIRERLSSKSCLGNPRLADFVIQHGHQKGLLLTVEKLCLAHLNRPGLPSISLLNVNNDFIDFSKNAKGQLVAKINLSIFNFVENNSDTVPNNPVNYYAYNSLTQEYTAFGDENIQIDLLTKPTVSEQQYRLPVASARAEIIIEPDTSAEGFRIDWQELAINVYHPNLLSRTQPIIPEVDISRKIMEKELAEKASKNMPGAK